MSARDPILDDLVLIAMDVISCGVLLVACFLLLMWWLP